MILLIDEYFLTVEFASINWELVTDVCVCVRMVRLFLVKYLTVR